MPLLTTFSDFMLATKAHKITGPKDILAEAINRTTFLKEMVKGRGVAEVVKTGSSIKDTIQLSDAGSFEFYSPHQRLNPIDVDTLVDVEIGWRFCVVHCAWADETIRLNKGSSEDVYVDLKYKYEQQMTVDNWNGMETALWAVPANASMEDGSGEAPVAYSIFALVNDQTNGLPSGFTTKLGVNPTTEERWRPQQATFTAGDPANELTGVFAAFDDMWLLCQFEAPDTREEYYETDKLRRMKIVSNRDGVTRYRQLLRSANDRTVSPQDPAYNSPTYSGVPLKYVSTLDTALLDLTNSTAWADGEPRYLWLNLEYLFPIWHQDGYMEAVGPINGGINQPFSHAMFKRTWWNLFARSLQRQGCVYPAA